MKPLDSFNGRPVFFSWPPALRPDKGSSTPRSSRPRDSSARFGVCPPSKDARPLEDRDSWPRDPYTLVYYDGPVAVAAIQDANTVYVGVKVDEEGEVQRWLVSTLGSAHAIRLLEGASLLRDALVTLGGTLVDQTDFDSVMSAIHVQGEHIPDTYLPEADATFDLSREALDRLEGRT